jgi:hypothetical protein
MIGLLAVLLTITLAMGVAAGSLFGLRDRSVLASPPESVVEDFVRKLAAERYVRAHNDLSDDVAEQVTPDSLRALLHMLEGRVGKIIDVHGERLWMTDGVARATAILTTHGDREVSVEFPLTWSSGEWSIADLRGLEGERS